MTTELFIERWFAIGWLIFGISHLLYPAEWAALFLPLRERATGGLLLATFYLPLGLAVVLAHNVWVLGLPVVVTLAGWILVVKSLVYLFYPRALFAIMPGNGRMKNGFRIAGLITFVLGALMTYQSFYRK